MESKAGVGSSPAFFPNIWRMNSPCYPTSAPQNEPNLPRACESG